MALIKLFDKGKDISLSELNMINTFCSKDMNGGYSITLCDERGITNDPRCEEIVSIFTQNEQAILILINNKDKMTIENIDIISDWLLAYGSYLRIGIVIEDIKELEYYDLFFSLVKDPTKVLLLLNIVDENPPIEDVLNTIAKNHLGNNLFIGIDKCNTNMNFKNISNIISNTNEFRRQNEIALGFGCGFKMCDFTKEQLGDIMFSPTTNFYFYCTAKVIIGPELKAKYCSVLNYEVFINDYHNVIEAHMALDTMKVLDKKVHQECIDKNCWAYNKICGGGCFKK